MQRFRVVYRGISHESLVFSGIHTSLYEIQVTSGIFHGYTTRKGCITILYHAIECSGQMGRLDVIQLKCTDRWEGSVEY